jgi:glutathione synthase/RimK-type ligase-like ATP-grasp enzyme
MESILLLYSSCEEENAKSLRYHLDRESVGYSIVVTDALAQDDCFTLCPASLVEWQQQIKVVWCRKPTLVVASGTSAAIRAHKSQELAKIGTNIAAVLNQSVWVNDFFAESRASNKLYQLVTAETVGLSVPRWICTNKTESVREFARAHSGHRIIAKCFYQGYFQDQQWIPTSIIEPDALTGEHLGIPMLFQDYVEKAFELRVTIVGDCMYACKIDSQSSTSEETRTDWRHYDLSATPHECFELPSVVRRLLVDLMGALSLRFGCVDLVVTPKNEYVFLEVNSSGQWGWIECITGMPITQALARLLVDVARESRRV